MIGRGSMIGRTGRALPVLVRDAAGKLQGSAESDGHSYTP
jgi:hypothetical protein